MAEQNIFLEADASVFDGLHTVQPGQTIDLLKYNSPDNPDLTSLVVQASADIGGNIHLATDATTALDMNMRQVCGVLEDFIYELKDPGSQDHLEWPGRKFGHQTVLFNNLGFPEVASHLMPIMGGNRWLLQSRLRNFGSERELRVNSVLFVDQHLLATQALINALTGATDSDPSEVLVSSTLFLKMPTPETKTEAEHISTSNPYEKFFGIDHVIDELRQVATIANHAQEAEAAGIPLIQGILLHGPSGVGKTELMYALGEDLGAEILNPTFSQIGGMHVSEQASNLEQLFVSAEQCDHRVLIVLDELDGLTLSGNLSVDGAISAVLKRQLEAIKSSPNVFFVAATNHLDRIDPNIRANKRLPLQIGIGLPGEDQRRELLAQLIVKQHLKNINLDGLDAPEQLTKVEAWLPAAINQVVETTQGFSYGEISTILTDAKRRRFLDSVSDPSKASSDILSIEEVRQAVNRFRHSKN